MKTQLVSVEYRNGGTQLYKFISKNPITIDDVAARLEDDEGFNPDLDTATFLYEITEINLD